VLDGGGWSNANPYLFYLGERTPVITAKKGGWAQGLVSMGMERRKPEWDFDTALLIGVLCLTVSDFDFDIFYFLHSFSLQPLPSFGV
jgi:hypothetical protein